MSFGSVLDHRHRPGHSLQAMRGFRRSFLFGKFKNVKFDNLFVLKEEEQGRRNCGGYSIVIRTIKDAWEVLKG